MKEESLITFDKVSSDEKDNIVRALKSQRFPVRVKEFEGNKFWVYTTYKGVRWYWHR